MTSHQNKQLSLDNDLTPEQKSFFRDNGYLALPAALTKKQVGPIREHILGELKRLRIWSSGKFLSASIQEIPPFQQVARLSRLIKYPDLQAGIITREVSSAIHSLAETKLVSAQDAQLLLSLPNQGEWRLDGLNWHVDISSSRISRLPGIQAFVLIDDVRIHGGATLAIVGSHHLGSNEESKKRLHEVLRGGGELQEKLRASDLSILEMTGQAGDVYLMDMRLLHTPSINSTKNVRMMATARYLAV